MTKRRVLLLGLVLCVELGAWFAYVWFRPGGINRATVLRIRAGMNEQEVERIIGVPHGDYRSFHGLTIVELGGPNEERVRLWHADNGRVAVWFNADGTVNERSYTPADWTLMDRVCEWLGVN